MEGYSLFVWIIVGGLAGWLAGTIMQGRGFGCLGNVIVGLVGAVIGGYVLGKLDIRIGGGILDPILTSFIGAVLFLAVVNVFAPRRR